VSADNWTICPKCKKVNDKAVEDALNLPGKIYGKVPLEEYTAALSAAKSLPKLSETLREDFEVGIYNGKFSVSYGARCTDCDFTFKHSHEEELK